MKSVLSVATKRCYTEYAGKKHSFRGCAFLAKYATEAAGGRICRRLPDIKEKFPVIKECIKINKYKKEDIQKWQRESQNLKK